VGEGELLLVGPLSARRTLDDVFRAMNSDDENSSIAIM
jgi:hypothetical protein